MSKTSQPKWKYIETIGDHDTPMFDGALLFTDETGVYAPELECYAVAANGPEDEWESFDVVVYRIIVEKYDWVMDGLNEVSGYVSDNLEALRLNLLSGDPTVMAHALYDLAAGYYGFGEFDQYPKDMKMLDAIERVRKLKEGTL